MRDLTPAEITEIVEQFDVGFKCFYHIKTGELLFVPDTLQSPEFDTEYFQDELDEIANNLSDYIEIEAPDSATAFSFMAEFAENIKNPFYQRQLVFALQKRKPFREFNHIIRNAGKYRQMWFDYKKQRMIEWVTDHLRKLKNYLNDDNPV